MKKFNLKGMSSYKLEDLSKYASRHDSSNLFENRRVGGWEKILSPDKKAAHGDMSRLGGERHLIC